MQRRAEKLGCEIRTSAKVVKILTKNNRAYGIKLENGEELHAENIITTADTKLAMEKLTGYDILKKANSKYAYKARSVKMSVSSVTISPGLDNGIDLESLGLDCGYNVITTGLGTFEKLFKAFDNDSYLLDEKKFHCAAICPSLTTGGKPVIIIRVVPVPMKNWKTLRENDYEAYVKQKEEGADFYVSQIEKYLIPNLREHIVYRDIATPATFERYTGSPTGSNYDMAPYPDNFGIRRLKMRTPIRGLFQPKFSHGIWPSLQAGIQVIDMITGGRIIKGRSRYKTHSMIY
jgi:all-trans-retinol 13,14-reductase